MVRRVARLVVVGALVWAIALASLGRLPAGNKDKPASEERAEKPSDKRIEIATYHGAPEKGEPSILVQRPADQDTWARVAPRATVFTTDQLVSLPGYASDLRTKTGVQLLLWGTLPEFNVKSPTCPYQFESAVTLHANSALDLELTLERGRIYLSNVKEKPASIRLRLGKEIWDLVLHERGAEVLVEFIPRYTGKTDTQDGEEPFTYVTLVVMKGKASLKYDRFHELPSLESPPGAALVAWDNKSKELTGPYKIEKDSPLIGILGKEPSDPQSAKAIKNYRPILEELRTHLSDKQPLDVLVEGIKIGKTAEQKALCVYGLGAIDAVPALLDVIANDDEKAGPQRDQAVIALRRWICRGSQTRKQLYNAKTKEGLLPKKGYKPVEAESVCQLLYLQIGDDTAKRRDVYETLVGYLRHSKMAVREMAFYHLKQLTYGLKNVPEYDPAWKQAQRDKAADEWEALIKKGELPPPPPK